MKRSEGRELFEKRKIQTREALAKVKKNEREKNLYEGYRNYKVTRDTKE